MIYCKTEHLEKPLTSSLLGAVLVVCPHTPIFIDLNHSFRLLGLATYLHVDFWRSIIPQSTTVKGIADAGWFLDTLSVYGKWK